MAVDWTREELHRYLRGAVALELLTIPPYLTAMYSLRPGANEEASLVIRSVVVEEMLHLTLASNVLNATGGRPDVTTRGYAPEYPSALPYHDPPSFHVGLLPFGPEALATFLAIENPTSHVSEPPEASEGAAIPAVTAIVREQGYTTIGAFYAAIEEGLKVLAAQEDLFDGDPARQIGPDQYYASGGEVIVVEGLESALEALDEIVEQGEGEVKDPGPEEKFDEEGDLAHYYRFNELRCGRHYRVEDEPDEPTGPPIEIDWEAVYPMKPDLKVAELSGELAEAAEAFNRLWGGLLDRIQAGIDGNPDELPRAVVQMFALKDAAIDLLRTPLEDGSGLNAGPTFEYPGLR